MYVWRQALQLNPMTHAVVGVDMRRHLYNHVYDVVWGLVCCATPLDEACLPPPISSNLD